MVDEDTIWSFLGEEGCHRLASAFYAGVREDPILGPMYPQDDWEGAENRLALFFRFRFGADETYLKERGHPRLRMRHGPFEIGEKERDRWLELMQAAVDQTVANEEVAAQLMEFFGPVADFMRNRPG